MIYLYGLPVAIFYDLAPGVVDHVNINGTPCTLIRPTATWLSGIFTEHLAMA
jgi:hypothetical protein